MAERVWMTHPELPGRRVQVRAQAAGIYGNSGWTPEQADPDTDRVPDGDAGDNDLDDEGE